MSDKNTTPVRRMTESNDGRGCWNGILRESNEKRLRRFIGKYQPAIIKVAENHKDAYKVKYLKSRTRSVHGLSFHDFDEWALSALSNIVENLCLFGNTIMNKDTFDECEKIDIEFRKDLEFVVSKKLGKSVALKIVSARIGHSGTPISPKNSSDYPHYILTIICKK